MITDINELRKALRRNRWRGIVLYEGTSQIDGMPIVAIANRITQASSNAKTGAMVQTWILRSDINPVEALASGADVSICGGCKHRPREANGKGRTCYVNISRAPLGVFKAYRNGRYARAGVDFDKALLPALFEGLDFRAGSYGDPAAVPFMVWRMCTLRVHGLTGYSHQWRDSRFQAFKLLCMASVDSASEALEAMAMGWRYFRVRHASEIVVKGQEAICPASAEAGHKTDCASCRACGGLSAKAKVSMVIVAHGATANQFQLAA